MNRPPNPVRHPVAFISYWLFEEPTVPTEDEVKREETIAGLRALADLMERCPDAQAPYSIRVYHSIYSWDTADPKAEFLRVMKAIGGRWDKLPEGDQFKLKQKLGGSAEYVLSVAREAVCEARVVGSRMVERPAIEYRPPPTELVREDIIEWDCPEVLR
jgi:hypothetical protein